MNSTECRVSGSRETYSRCSLNLRLLSPLHPNKHTHTHTHTHTRSHDDPPDTTSNRLNYCKLFPNYIYKYAYINKWICFQVMLMWATVTDSLSNSTKSDVGFRDHICLGRWRVLSASQLPGTQVSNIHVPF